MWSVGSWMPASIRAICRAMPDATYDGILPRAGVVERTRDEHWQPLLLPDSRGQHLLRELAGGVRAGRRDRVVLAKRPILRPVHRGGTRDQRPRVRPNVGKRAQQVVRAEHVVLIGLEREPPRFGHVRRAGEMVDGVGSDLGEGASHGLAVEQLDRHPRHIGSERRGLVPGRYHPTTFAPSASSRSSRCPPTNPAAPVTRIGQPLRRCQRLTSAACTALRSTPVCGIALLDRAPPTSRWRDTTTIVVRQSVVESRLRGDHPSSVLILVGRCVSAIVPGAIRDRFDQRESACPSTRECDG